MRALTHALESQRLHHAYLFTGTRGVGKTTLSRILAKSLNCIGRDGDGGITAQPCGVCPVCMAIDAGRFVDYIEMDAASNRGVDEMAQLLEQAVYAPSNARFKVYMIDEVHMLSNHAFNAMLKTLEEPPEHVKFILATTDPQKIPVTVLSRCLQFNLKQMPPGHIIAHLDDILGQEGIEFEQPALRLLAQGAHGSMRDALSLADQAIAYAAGKVTLEAVQGMLGALDQSYLIRLLDALVNQDGADLLAVADEMAARSLSYNGALQDLGTLLHRIALAQTVPAAVPGDLPEREDIMRLAGLFDPEEVQLNYQIAVHGRNELGLAPDEYAGFSMTLLRMLAFRPDDAGVTVQTTAAAQPGHPAPRQVSVSPVKEKPAASLSPAHPAPNAPAPAQRATLSPARAALEAARAGLRPQASTAGTAPKAQLSTPVRPGASAPGQSKAALPWEENQQPNKTTPAAVLSVTSEKAPSQVIDIRTKAAPPGELPALATIQPSPPEAVPGLQWDGDWPRLASQLPMRGVAQQLALQTELVKCAYDGDAALFHFLVPIEALRMAANVDKLAAALTDYFGKPARVTTEIGVVMQTADKRARQERDVLQQQAEQTIKDDPFVQSMVREFGASVVAGSIKPT